MGALALHCKVYFIIKFCLMWIRMAMAFTNPNMGEVVKEHGESG